MSADDRLDRRIDWTRRGSIALLALILAVTAWTLPRVGDVQRSQRDERELLREQNELLEAQNDDLADLIERQEAADAGREDRLQRTIDEVEVLLIDHFALHDRNTAEKLNEALARIAVLVDRPPPEPIRPSPPQQQRSDPPTAPPATSTAPAPSTTTTTSPGQSGLCERIPTAFPCRSDR